MWSLSFLIECSMSRVWSLGFASLIQPFYREVKMSKGKNKGGGKVGDLDKIISEWEEKLSVAKVNKNHTEASSIQRMIDFYKRKKETKQ